MGQMQLLYSCCGKAVNDEINTLQVLYFTRSVPVSNTKIKFSTIPVSGSTFSSTMKLMENVSRFYSHCDLALGLPVFSRPAAVANPCPTIDFIGLPLEPTAEGWP